jgi:phosphoribosylformimino-5-aminoimidazole carboxamide ribotide isomerase
MQGIQIDLLEMLGEYSPIPTTYAGGVSTLLDMDRVKTLGNNQIDLTIGSALDIFGGHIPYKDVVAWHRAN